MNDTTTGIILYLTEELESSINTIQSCLEYGIFDPLLAASAIELAEETQQIATLYEGIIKGLSSVHHATIHQ